MTSLEVLSMNLVGKKTRAQIKKEALQALRG